MKRLIQNIFLWILPFFLLITATAQAEDAPAAPAASVNQYKRYSVKSAVIEYALSGIQTGTETVYIDDYGKREARYTQADMNVMGQTMKSNRLTLLDEDWIYAIDLDKKSGAKIKNPMFESLRASAPDGDYSQVSLDLMQKMGGQKIGTEEIAGKTCDVWEMKDMETKSWLWNVIPLKTESKMGELQMSTVATKVDEGVPVADEKFKIPADVQITSGENLDQMMKSMEETNQNNQENQPEEKTN